MNEHQRGNQSIRVGGGSAFFNDRLDAAVELVEKGDIDVLMLETLAERTLTLLHVAKRNGGKGYWEQFADRLDVLLPVLVRHKTRLVTNVGGADPVAAAAMVASIARKHGAKLKIATVTGDNVSDVVRELDPVLLETGQPLSRLGISTVSTNVYLGADEIAEAYAAGADIILTGRVTDSALALGPIMATLGWKHDDLQAMACGVLAGHLLECGGQATGGYFAEPGFKEVPDLDRIGFPIAQVFQDRSIRVSKPLGSGGRIDRHTITEQILYEMHDPGQYLTPDVTLDVTSLHLIESAPDEVTITGVVGKPAPETLKVLIGVDSGILAEIEISYMGINCEARARLAADTVRKRVARIPEMASLEVRIDLIGISSLWPGPVNDTCREVRLRVASRVPTRTIADQLVTEVESLYVNGPAGGGGVRIGVRPTNRTYTAFIPRSLTQPRWAFAES